MDDELERWKQLVETRRAEAIALFTTSQAYNARNDQLVALGVTIIGASAAVGLKQHFEEVLLAIPVALLLLMIYATQVDTDVRVMGIARARVEEVLAGQLSAAALIYQSHAAKFRQHPYINGFQGVQIVLVLVTVGTACAAADVAEDRSFWVLVVYLGLLLSLSACLALAFWDRRNAQSAAKKELAGWPNPAPGP